jgi:hypothetical protein
MSFSGANQKGWRDVDRGDDRGLCGHADRRANAAQAAARDYNYWGALLTVVYARAAFPKV